tara:strand:- start:5193 stop:5858 length:666 start_codon:yes stop_codon:yes gene_type:complete
MSFFRKFLSFVVPLCVFTEQNETEPFVSNINQDINEHRYIITQVILNKAFDNTIMVKDGDWKDLFETDISNELSIDKKQVDLIGTWDSTEDDVNDVIVDFLIYGNTEGSDPDKIVETLKDNVDDGCYLENVDANVYGITVNDKTIYDKSRWQRAKDYANNKWDTFQNAEMSAPIVTAWVLGLGIPFCVCIGYILYKCKEKQNQMVDEGVVTVKLNTVKTSI